MASLLVCHELEEIAVVLSHSSLFELGYGECLEAVVEQVELRVT